jgi:GNAT superfamily N-acetyltransferase
MTPLKRNDIQDDYLTIIQLSRKADFERDEVGLFDCGDSDLNEFLRKDAWEYKKQLLAETYLCFVTKSFVKNELHPIAYISFCNDCIQLTKEQKKKELKKFFNCFKRKLPNQKRLLKSYPAVKIARLAVSQNAHRGGVGTHLLNMVKNMFKNGNRTGCKFLTVDAYNNPKTISFYKNKNNFDFLWEKDQNNKQRIMWFDLATFDYKSPDENQTFDEGG